MDNWLAEKRFFVEDIVVDEHLRFFSDIIAGRHSCEIKDGIYIVHCLSGTLTIQIDGNNFVLRNGNLLILRSVDIMKAELTQTEDFISRSMFVSMYVLCNKFAEHNMDVELSFINGRPLRKLSPQAEHTLQIFQMLLMQIWCSGTPHSLLTDSIYSLTVSMLNVIQTMMYYNHEDDLVANGQPEKIYMRFLKLLHMDRYKKRSLAFYADKLCISSKYLSAVCRKVTGMSAHKIITDAVVDDISYELKNTDTPISQIAENLGFTSLSFFGQYVRQHFGVSPREYRHGRKDTSAEELK